MSDKPSVLAFRPRTLQHPRKQFKHADPRQILAAAATQPVQVAESSSSIAVGVNEPSNQRDLEEIAILLRLLLTPYSLHFNAGLRAMVQEGWCNLKALAAHNPTLADVPAALLAASLADISFIETRLSLPDQQRVFGRPANSRGGYEVRLNDDEAGSHEWIELDRDGWMRKSIYLENFPDKINTIPSIYIFLTATLRDLGYPDERVQDIHFPSLRSKYAHDSADKFKGFIFVTLSSLKAVDALVEEFPYAAKACPESGSANPSNFSGLKFAHSCSLAAMKRAEFERRKEEYLEWQSEAWQKLDAVEELDSHAISIDHSSPVISKSSKNKIKTGRALTLEIDNALAKDLDYPEGCVIHLRHLPEGSSKTSIKNEYGGVYIDFTKGLDSAHIRFRTAEEASACLVSLQAPVKGEILSGMKESFYWNKIAVKIKTDARQASQQSNS